MFFWFKTEGPPHEKIVHSFKESSSSKNQIHRWSSEESCLDYNIYHSHCILYLFKFLANRKKLIFVPGRWGTHANGKQTWDEKLANNCMCYIWPNCAFMLGKVNCLHCTVGFIFFFFPILDNLCCNSFWISILDMLYPLMFIIWLAIV
jgi:hypothetical protein